MAFNFELTISGLCVIVLKSKKNRPEEPSAVEILCVGAFYHRPRLSYPPDYVKLNRGLEPELCVDSAGNRFTSIDVSNAALALGFKTNPSKKFCLKWGDTKQTTPPPPTDKTEAWMHWVPSVKDLDLKGIQLERTAHGISARLSLPPGNVCARSVIKDKENKYAVWNFPAVRAKRALANEIVYSAPNVEGLEITWAGHKLHYARNRDLRMCFSNDLETVPSDYSAGVTMLHHLVHLQNLADPLRGVKVPKLEGSTRTGRPICNQVFFVDKS